MRYLIGGVAAACALAVAPAASANHEIDCTREIAIVCTVVNGVTCHPHYHPCR